eukprot:8361601-Pyramimonas_sp.AAC.1
MPDRIARAQGAKSMASAPSAPGKKAHSTSLWAHRFLGPDSKRSRRVVSPSIAKRRARARQVCKRPQCARKRRGAWGRSG